MKAILNYILVTILSIGSIPFLAFLSFLVLMDKWGNWTEKEFTRYHKELND